MKEIKKIIPFIMSSRKIKYFRIILTEEVKQFYNENHTPEKEIKRI